MVKWLVHLKGLLNKLLIEAVVQVEVKCHQIIVTERHRKLVVEQFLCGRGASQGAACLPK